MATLHFNAKTSATPEQWVAALTDFGPGRSEIFENSADDDLKVHDRGPTEADVTEGSSGIWERLHYDWSDPSRIVLTTTDSNTWGGHSSHTYTFSSEPDGKTDVEYVVVRDGKNLKGRVLGNRSRDGRQRPTEEGFRGRRQRHRGPRRQGKSGDRA